MREEDCNEVLLRGRVTRGAEAIELPSGTRIVAFRLSVGRRPSAMTRGSKATVDWIDCAAWSAAARKKVSGWVAGDEVEVTGALRRRHFRGVVGGTSAVEIEVTGARRVRRADQPARQSSGAEDR